MANRRRILAAGAALLALILLTAITSTGRTTEAQQEVDISGHWNITALHRFAGPCPAVISQAGALLAVAVECQPSARQNLWHLHGTIDPATGEFAVSGPSTGFFRTDLEGTASGDGNSISGVSNSSLGSLDFTGERKDESLSEVSLSGNWSLVLAGGASETCTAGVSHAAENLSFDVDCGEAGSGSLIGTIDLSTGALVLSGSLFGADADLEGNVSLSGRAMSAVWSVPSIGFGTLTGGLKERVGGALALDCDAAVAGVQTACVYPTGSTFHIQIHVAEAPPGGYFAFQTLLRWSVPQLNYLPAADHRQEALWEDCDNAGRVDYRTMEPRAQDFVVAFICIPFPELSEASTLTGAIAQFAMECVAGGPGSLTLVTPDEAGTLGSQFFGRHLFDNGGDPVTPVVSNATVICEAGPPGPGRTFGDVNCNGLVSSIDALLVLQLEAGLITALACERNADVNEDDVISSLDASLILQFTAGLISDFS